LAAAFTVDTMPEATLRAFADHGKIESALSWENNGAEETLARFADAGVDVNTLATQLQDEGAQSFVKSWNDLMDVIRSKCSELSKSSSGATA